MATDPGSSSSSSRVPDPKEDVSAYLLRLQSALQPLTRDAAQLPAHGDLAFHRSMDRKLAKKLDAEADRVLHRISELAKWIAADPLAPKVPLLADKTAGKAELTHADVATKESFANNLGELVDHLLESADTCLDEYAGKLAPRNLTASSAADTAKVSSNESKSLPKVGPLPGRILNAPISPPPQRLFTTQPDNSVETPWFRTLKFGKPNALVPLGHVNQPVASADGEPPLRGPRRGMYCAEGDPLDNPYYHEIMHADPPFHALSRPDPRWKDNPPPPINEKDPSLSTDASPFIWVSTKQQIEALRDHLEEDRVSEIAIDLEHHSFRTYQGIVCLMQLSTRWGDWIIDTLADDVREHAELLNSSFTNPAKVKVLHGANHDVLWLQRDLGLYLVNLFDTYHATNVLVFPSHGLGYLMARYCDFDADKRYQLADWRIRPLPKEMLYYARSDTHTLLYIYDNLRHELMEAGGVDAIRQVFVRSKDVANAVYAKEEWDVEGETREGWRSLWRRWGGEAALGTENRTQLSDMKKEERLVRALHHWRDGVARQEDESPRYVLNATNLIQLASRAPTTPEGVLTCIPPNAAILKKRTKDIATLIAQNVAAWESDRKEHEQRKQQQLALGLENSAALGNVDVDIGQAVARSTVCEPISAQSKVAASLTPVDASVWTPPVQPALAAAAPSKSLFGGAMRTLASGLFGNRSKSAVIPVAPPAGTTRPLVSSSSKLFGGSALSRSAARTISDKVDSVKATFATEIGGVLQTAAAPTDEALVEQPRLEPETVAFVPLAERAPPAESAPTTFSTAAADSDDDDEPADAKQDYIIVSSAKHKSKSKTKEQDGGSTGNSTSKKKKKRKQPPSGDTLPAGEKPAKTARKLYAGEFDFSAPSTDSHTTGGTQFETPEQAPSPKPSAKNKSKRNNKGDSSTPSFRQPRDRARKNVGAGATL